VWHGMDIRLNCEPNMASTSWTALGLLLVKGGPACHSPCRTLAAVSERMQ